MQCVNQWTHKQGDKDNVDDSNEEEDFDDDACTVREEGGWRLGSCSQWLELLGRPRRKFQVIIQSNYEDDYDDDDD